MYVHLYVNYPLFLHDFNRAWIFSTGFRKIFKFQISWKSLQWQPSYSMRRGRQRDGRTDVMHLAVAFRNFENAPNEMCDLRSVLLVSKLDIVCGSTVHFTKWHLTANYSTSTTQTIQERARDDSLCYAGLMPHSKIQHQLLLLMTT